MCGDSHQDKYPREKNKESTTNIPTRGNSRHEPRVENRLDPEEGSSYHRIGIRKKKEEEDKKPLKGDNQKTTYQNGGNPLQNFGGYNLYMNGRPK